MYIQIVVLNYIKCKKKLEKIKINPVMTYDLVDGRNILIVMQGLNQ